MLVEKGGEIGAIILFDFNLLMISKMSCATQNNSPGLGAELQLTNNSKILTKE